MKNILAIDTATPACSIALLSDSKIRMESAIGKGIHSEAVFTFSRKLLQESGLSVSDLDAVLVPAGPGSYTGLRIASSSVKGLLFGLDTQVYAINTLAILAWVYRHSSQRIHAVLDARRSHLYHQVFSIEDGKLCSKNDVCIRNLNRFEDVVNTQDIITGTGLDRLPSSLENNLKPAVFTAQTMIEMFLEDSASDVMQKFTSETYQPNYFTEAPVFD